MKKSSWERFSCSCFSFWGFFFFYFLRSDNMKVGFNKNFKFLPFFLRSSFISIFFLTLLKLHQNSAVLNCHYFEPKFTEIWRFQKTKNKQQANKTKWEKREGQPQVKFSPDEKSKSVKIWYFFKSIWQIVIFSENLQSSKLYSREK